MNDAPPLKKKRGPPKGVRYGGGSRKGIPNKVGREDRLIARKYGPDALLALAVQAGLTKPLKRLPDIKLAQAESVQQGAARELLDRAYGKPSQPMEHTVDETFEAILDRLGR
jgi:hypothetical protein